jgi:hypothetical protein
MQLFNKIFVTKVFEQYQKKIKNETQKELSFKLDLEAAKIIVLGCTKYDGNYAKLQSKLLTSKQIIQDENEDLTSFDFFKKFFTYDIDPTADVDNEMVAKALVDEEEYIKKTWLSNSNNSKPQNTPSSKNNSSPLNKKFTGTTEELIEIITDTVTGETMNGVEIHQPVWLWGPMGTGKTTIINNLCKAKGYEIYKVPKGTYKEDIYGYKLPSGEWSNTTLCRAVLDDKPDNVKRFVIFDEFDTFGEGASVAANNTLSQGEVIINDVVHYIKPNTIFIAISNTNGKGATDVYTARNSIDDATVDRFTFIKVEHDFKREQAVTNDNRELITFCHKMRAFFEQNGYNTQFSLRTLIQITNLQDKIGVEKALEISLLKQLTDDVDFFNLFNEQYAMSAENNIYEETMKRISLRVIENMKNQNA